MVRRSGRNSAGSAPNSAHKRAASNTTHAIVAVKRSKPVQTTPTKSQYFESAGETEASESESADNDDESDFDGDEQATPSERDTEDEPEDDETDDEPTPRRKKPGPKAKNGALGAPNTEKDLWRPGVKTGLGPGKQVVIKKPKARAPGKTPYSDETIHPNTFLFLADLKANNNRDWLKLHDADFRASEKDWHSFVEKMTEKLIEADDSVPELPVKDVVFRIYRDVRFSKDPTPYKPYFSVAWSRAGRKSPYAHYYVQIAPGKSFVGGGIWHPDADPTAALRQDIDRSPRRIKDVLGDKHIREEFLDKAGKTDQQVVKAFVKSNAENALKTKPKGYDADHPDIDLLRLRNFTIGRSLADDEVLGTTGAQRIAYLLACLKPFITYLNSVVMPDNNDEEGSRDDDDEEDEESDE